MDKYQEYLIHHIDHSYFDLAINKATRGDDGACQGKRDRIVLKQNEDIAIKDYTLYIANSAIESIFCRVRFFKISVSVKFKTAIRMRIYSI